MQHIQQTCNSCWLICLLLTQPWTSAATAAAAAAAANASSSNDSERLVTIRVNRLAEPHLASAAAAAGDGVYSTATSNSSSSSSDVQVQLLGSDREVQLLVALKSRNPVGLDAAAHQCISALGSSQQRQQQQRRHLTPAQFGQKFGASNTAVRAVKRYFKSKGLKVTVTPNKLYLEVSGPAARISAAVNTQIVLQQQQQRQQQQDGTVKMLYAPMTHPRLPANVAKYVTNILGLDNIPVTRSAHRLGSTPISAAAAAAANATSSSSHAERDKQRSLLQADEDRFNQYLLTVDRMRSVYNLPTSDFNGNGTTIAVLAYQQYEKITVVEFAEANDLPFSEDLFDIFVVNPNLVDDEDPGPTLVNLELVIAVAPLASITVYLSENSDFGEALLFNKVANDNRDSTVLYSWWRQEFANDTRSEVARLLQQMVIQGQTVIVSSGDCGSNLDDVNSTACSSVTGVNFPASSPYVTAVGGTTPTLYFGDLWAREIAWEGSGGGFSTVFPLPSYQQGVPTLVNQRRRNLPDVALAANPDDWPYEILLPEGEWSTADGTAASASVWAGFNLLVNQCRRRARIRPTRIGALNPYLYRIGASSSDYTTAMHDPSQGSNGAYTAGPGWDAVTGWGSMNGKQLTNLLCPGYLGACCYVDRLSGPYCVPSTTAANCLGTFQPGKTCHKGDNNAATCAR